MFDSGTMKSRELRNCCIVAGIVLLAAGVLLLIRHPMQRAGTYVQVLLDGEEYARYPLTEDGVYRIAVSAQEYNVVTIQGGTASVTEASCPNQVCVHTKAVRYTGETISCLPHHLQVRIEGGEEPAYDAITN
ncbi:MAG: NusG domain II-containing protein [Lachnospiraceae bacterium]|nr:NusG domain II-containing protein [Lachnospiraceae bacterium]